MQAEFLKDPVSQCTVWHFVHGSPLISTDVGNEDLYGIVTGMTVAMASLSWHREEVKTLNDLICKRYGEQETALKGRVFVTTVIIVASVLVAAVMAPVFGTAAVVSGALVATPSAVFTGKDVREMCNSRNKRAEAGACKSPFCYKTKFRLDPHC